MPSVVDYIKQSLELRKGGSHWSMYNSNYDYITFLYVVHVYMFCNVVCIVLLYPQGFYLQQRLLLLKIRSKADFRSNRKIFDSR